MDDVIPRRVLDAGQPLLTMLESGEGFRVVIHACVAPRCPCSTVELKLAPLRSSVLATDELDDAPTDEEGEAAAFVTFDVTTRGIMHIDDDERLLQGACDEAWVREQLTGDLGDLVAARLARLRAAKDRGTWRAYDWTIHRPGDAVAHDALFPHDWDLVFAFRGRAIWLRDLYCVRPGCACQDVVLQVQDVDGVQLGEARVRLGSRPTVSVVKCDRDAVAVVRDAVERLGIGRVLHQRFHETRAIARRLKTWVSDVARPEATIEAILDGRDTVDVDLRARVRAVGQPAIAPLAAVVVDGDAPRDRRLRAIRLLSAIGDPACARPLAVALAWQGLDLGLDSDLDAEDDVREALRDLGRLALEPLLEELAIAPTAAVATRVAEVLADLRVADPRVLALVADRAQREGDPWIGWLEWQEAAAVPVARRLLADVLAAAPLDVEAAHDLVDVLEKLGEEIEPELVERIDVAEAAARAADREAAADARRAAEEAARRAAETARQADEAARAYRFANQGALAEIDRRLASGRNRPCWCGSDEKYKKCHLAADEIERRRLLLPPRPSPTGAADHG